MPIATLTIDVNAKLANLQTTLDKAAHLSEQSAKRMEGAFRLVGTSLAGIAGGASFGGFVALVQSLNNQVDALNDVRDATGASIENISALEDVARRTGTTLDTAGSILVKFNAALKDSDSNTGIAETFKALGLNVAELKRLDPAEALLKTSKALTGFADDGNKARIVQELFGKSVREAAPFLNDLAEKGLANATVTAEQAAAAEKFNKQLFELQTNIGNAARAISMNMVPALSGYISRIGEAMEATGGYVELLRTIANGSWKDAFKTGIGLLSPEFGPSVAASRKELAGLADDLEKEQKRLADLQNRKYLNPVERDDLRTTEGNIARIEAKITEAKKRHELAKAFQRQTALDGSGEILDANDARARGGALPSLRSGLPPAKGSAKAAKEYDAELEMSRRAAQAYAGTLEKLTAAQVEAEQSTLTLTPSQKALRDLMADPVWQTMPEPWKQTAIAQTEASVAAERIAADQKRLQDLLTATDDAALARMRDTMEFLAQAFEDGRINAEQFSQAASKVAGLDAGMREVADEIDQFWVGAARNIQSTIADALVDGFDNGGKTILADFGKLIQRLIAQAVAADLAKRLFGPDFASGKGGDVGGWLGDLGGWLGGLFKSANGNAFGASGAVSAFASGGAFGNGEILTRPTLFRFADGGAFRLGVAGEAGAEGALPLKRMSNGKLGVYADGGGGGPVINIHQNFPAGTPAETRRAAAQGAREALAAMNRARRYG